VKVHLVRLGVSIFCAFVFITLLGHDIDWPTLIYSVVTFGLVSIVGEASQR
jgi:hypothetical protein